MKIDHLDAEQMEALHEWTDKYYKERDSVIETLEEVHRIDHNKLIQHVSNWKVISMLTFLLGLGIGMLAVHYIIMGG